MLAEPRPAGQLGEPSAAATSRTRASRRGRARAPDEQGVRRGSTAGSYATALVRSPKLHAAARSSKTVPQLAREHRAVEHPAERSAAVNAAIEQMNPSGSSRSRSSTPRSSSTPSERWASARFRPRARKRRVGIASGSRWLGRRVVLIVQDNGIGNALTALTTFPQAYHVPASHARVPRGGLASTTR